MRSSALPFLSSRSRIAEAICAIDIYILNEPQSEICLNPRNFFPGETTAVSSPFLPGIGDPDFLYSVRNAAIGLIRVARRAGSQVAITVAAPRISGALANAI